MSYQEEGYNFLLGVDQILDSSDGINTRNNDEILEAGSINIQKVDAADAGMTTGDDGLINFSGDVIINGTPASTITEAISPSGEINAGAGGYYNFGEPLGVTGYGMRDNGGDVEYKNLGGSWAPLGGGSSLNVINPNALTSITLALTDGQTLMVLSAATDITITIPNESLVNFPIGTQIDIICYFTGIATFTTAVGVELTSKDGNRKINGRYVGVSLIKWISNAWFLIGDLTA